MFQPHYICILSVPDDLVRQLISLRLKNLNDKNAQLNQDYQFIQKQLKDYEKHYRKSPLYFSTKHQQSQIKLAKLLQQVQLQHYCFTNNIQQKQSKKFQIRQRVSKHIKTSSQDKQKSASPYHFQKFRSSLNKFALTCHKQNDKIRFSKLRPQGSILEQMLSTQNCLQTYRSKGKSPGNRKLKRSFLNN